MLLHRGREGKVPGHPDLFPDKFRRGPAAAPQHVDRKLRDLQHLRGKFLRSQVVDRLPVLRAGKAGVRIDDDRQGTDFRQFLHDRQHLPRAQSAVHAQGIHAQSFHHRCDALHRPAGQELALPVVDRGDADRQIRVLLRRKNCCFCLQAVAHGLDEDEVCPCIRAEAHHLRKDGHGFFKVQISHRLQEPSRGPDVQGDKAVLPAGQAPGFLHVVHACLHDGLQVLRVRVMQPVRSEGIGVYDVASRFQVRDRQLDDVLRPCQVPPLRKLPALQPLRLENGTGSSVPVKTFLSETLQKTLLHL